jgi:hypothetical protein
MANIKLLGPDDEAACTTHIDLTDLTLKSRVMMELQFAVAVKMHE